MCAYYHLSTFLSGWTSFPLLSSHNHSSCICLLIILSKLLSLSLSVSLSHFNISICDALWKKPYLRFLQQCCRGLTMIFYKAVFSPLQHSNTLKVVHFEGLD
jgi:hypothetical protein